MANATSDLTLEGAETVVSFLSSRIAGLQDEAVAARIAPLPNGDPFKCEPVPSHCCLKDRDKNTHPLPHSLLVSCYQTIFQVSLGQCILWVWYKQVCMLYHLIDIGALVNGNNEFAI